MAKLPLVSVIIVNWNGGEVFKKCLSSLDKLTYPSYELIIVDNGSTDGTEKLAKIKNKTNLGFAQANNQGYASATGDYILLLNNDTRVEPHFLGKLIKRMDADDYIGVIQPKIYIMDKPQLLDTIGSFLTRTGFLQHLGYLQADAPQFNKEMEIFSAKGACMLIRREVIEKVGLFDAGFGSYFEETDFCWRVWLAGWKVMYCPDSHIYHKIGFTTKRMSNIDISYNSFKNRLCSLIKNLEFFSLYILLIHLIIVNLLLFYYLIKRHFSKFGMLWRAVYWNFAHLPETLEKRRQIQELRTISDFHLFPHILKPFDWRFMFTHFLRSEKDYK